MFDTQQDKDKEYWNVDAGALRWQMEQRDVKHVHMPFVDFNADSLREGLPRAVAVARVWGCIFAKRLCVF